ncbi:MAG: tRNA (cytidine(34)-2'-O)-methyltransferase, partial [Nitrospirota bacterium]|nr:tRNA (cytidine(34)-2'-O)-methyltransferase [Nitrospirota bacterium]
MLHVVLYQPEIPPNTGNIARQCVGMDAFLHIIGPTTIDLSHKSVKRAGLDYWDELKLVMHE